MLHIGIDYGDKRIGIAKGDLTNTIAGAVGTIEARGFEDAVEKTGKKIVELAAKSVEIIVILGLPRNMDGSEGFRADKTKKFSSHLMDYLQSNVPQIKTEIILTDERLTTAISYQYMNITQFNGRKRKKVIDALSAQVILQDYLDSTKIKMSSKT